MTDMEKQEELFNSWTEVSYKVRQLGSIIQNDLKEFSIPKTEVDEWALEALKIQTEVTQLSTETLRLLRSH